MTCSEVQTELLSIDPVLLPVAGDSPMNAHLRACSRCQSTANRMLYHYERERDEYLGITSRYSPNEITTHVLARVGPVAFRAPRQRRMRRAALALIPLAAAAVAVTVVSMRRNARRDAFQQSVDAAFAASRMISSIQVPPGRNAAVFTTRDPDISVVWIY
jgi:hypothetical protein